MTNIEVFYTHTENNKDLGIGDDGKLYFGGKEVLTKSKITLNWWVNSSIIIASLATAIMAFFAIIEFIYYQPEFTLHVKESIYDECFEYYAEANRTEGISKETISTCWTKANDWTKEITK